MAQEFIEYQTQDGDRWDIVAWKMYGDPYAYEGILRANPDVAAEPVLEGGVTLRIPILEESGLHEEFAPWNA